MENQIVKLDLKDKKILYELDFNARLPYSQLAKKTGLSKQGAEYKVNNLIKKGIIKGFYPVINVPKLGYIYCRLSLVLRNVTPEIEEEILGYFKQDKQWFWVFSAQGAYDILAVLWAKSITDFKHHVSDLLSRYGQYIKDKNESIATDVIHYQHRYLLGLKETKEIHIKETNEHYTLDEPEKKILQALCEDARMPAVQIAKRAGVSAKAASYKIKKLEQNKIIEGYRITVDHIRLGYTYFKLWINIQYENIEDIRRLHSYVRNNPIVLYIVEGSGLPEDLDVEVMVKNNIELFEFIKDLKLKFPKLIGDYRTFMFIDTKKVRYLPF
ncbi:Lrp/AsnC family transcriptional regulator [Candidatus Woesearchaeota archaeon]|nr:Lrp/AsnC family transcriptional regulator [Candidatus Woesearchaeota archaeon]